MDKARPDYDASGIALGDDWLVFPALTSTVNYDDNVFRSQRQEAWDWYFENTPSFRLQQKTADGQFDLLGDVDTFRHTRFSRLDLDDWSVGADGKLNFSKVLNAAAAGYYGKYHEDFESINDVFSGRAQRTYTRYYRGHAETLVNYTPQAWAFSLGTSFDRYDWQPTTLLNGSVVSNGFRDETAFSPYVRVAYQALPGYQLFVKAVYDERDFDQQARSSSGSRLEGGISLALGTSLSGEIYAGYLQQEFKIRAHPPLDQVSELDYGAELTWYAAPVLTVHFTAARAISDVFIPGVSFSDDQSVRLGADWEVRHDVILQGFGAYTDSRLLGSTRTDRYPSAGLTLRYLVNHYMSVEAAYLYTARGSTVPNADFAAQILTVGVNLHI